jgi:hypothetical protein
MSIEAAKVTAETVINHLREYGPNARVLIMAPNKKVLWHIIESDDGLLARYGDQFSSVKPMIQMTHNGGGYVRVTDTYAISRGFIAGLAFTLVWAENVGTESNEEAQARDGARLQLRLGPAIFLDSHNGTYTEA